MEKVRPWCGQPSDRGRLRNRTEQNKVVFNLHIKYTMPSFTCSKDRRWPQNLKRSRDIDHASFMDGNSFAFDVCIITWHKFVSDIAIFVLKRDVKLQLTN